MIPQTVVKNETSKMRRKIADADAFYVTNHGDVEQIKTQQGD